MGGGGGGGRGGAGVNEKEEHYKLRLTAWRLRGKACMPAFSHAFMLRRREKEGVNLTCLYLEAGEAAACEKREKNEESCSLPSHHLQLSYLSLTPHEGNCLSREEKEAGGGFMPPSEGISSEEALPLSLPQPLCTFAEGRPGDDGDGGDGDWWRHVWWLGHDCAAGFLHAKHALCLWWMVVWFSVAAGLVMVSVMGGRTPIKVVVVEEASERRGPPRPFLQQRAQTVVFVLMLHSPGMAEASF